MRTVEDHYDQFLADRYTWMSGGHGSQVADSRKVLTDFGFIGRTGAMALDLGCGSGYQSLALTDLGFSVIAVDTSQQLLDELNSLAAGKSISVVRGDMRNSETYAPHAPFDAVVCMGDTLLHVSSPEDVQHLFEDLYAHTRGGGKLLISFRDLSTNMRGIDRAIPVRLDEHELMVTFLEYTESHVNVHDMLFTQRDGKWQMTKSAYQKLRLPGNAAVSMLTKAGFANIRKTVERGFTVIAADKTAD